MGNGWNASERKGGDEMSRLQVDTVPAVVVLVFAAMLAAVWSIETLERPSLQPQGPVEVFSTGGSWCQVCEAPR